MSREVKTISPIQTNYKNASTDELRRLRRYLVMPVFELLENICRNKVQKEKDFIWITPVDDTKSMIKAAERKGFGVGIQWVLDVKRQVNEEIERRSEEKRNELEEAKKKNLQKNL